MSGDHTGDPYQLLDVPRDAAPRAIRKAYFLLARRVHPDRNPSADAAAAFQALQKAYGILSDPAKRKLFDKTGCTDQDSEAFWEAYQQYRTIYPEVNKEDIAAFAQKYRGSAEEEGDLRAFYTEKGGDMSTLQAHIMVSRLEDAERFQAFFDTQIASGALPRTEEYDRTKHLCGQMPEEDDLKEAEEQDNVDEELEIEEDDGMSDFIVDDASDLEEDRDDLYNSAHDDDPRGIADSKRISKKRKRESSASIASSSSSSSSPSSSILDDESSAAKLSSLGSTKKAKTKKNAAAKQKIAQTQMAKANATAKRKKKKKPKQKKVADGDDMDSLRAMMLQRARNRHESMIDTLAAKYG